MPRTTRPFTPSQEQAENLDRRTVGREEVLAVLSQRLTSAATGKSRPHTLLVGPRGSGKSHLLRVALHRLSGTPTVSGRLAVADISEDVVGITRYGDLVWEVATALSIPAQRGADVVALEGRILDGIGDKTLVIVLENLDRVFRSIGTKGQQDLRSWVETSGRILILAATPSLFSGVQNRSQPWFGGIITTPVEALTVDEGHELLKILARENGDTALLEFLESDAGRSRVEAVARLTGGSARIWMLLSECINVENFDALVPAVEALLESLVPYYQQLLWDLPDNHQAIIRQLAEGPVAALTAVDIATASGLSQQTVSKALSLLEAARWLRAEKVPGGDSRKTWYSMREPMLRHHFQWRNTKDEPLTLIVELLRAWHSHHELRRQLATVPPLSSAERYLVSTLRPQGDRFDPGYSSLKPSDLASAARLWIAGASDTYTVDCGRYVELCTLLSENSELDVRAHLGRRRPLGPRDSDVVTTLQSVSERSFIGMLRATCAVTEGDTKSGLTLVASGWLGHHDAPLAHALLRSLDLQFISRDALRCSIELDTILWGSRAKVIEDPTLAATQLLPQISSQLGHDHRITLVARSQLAFYTGSTGDAHAAMKLYRELLPDLERVLGTDDRSTLNTRNFLVEYTGETGDAAGALRLACILLSDQERAFGPADRATLRTRNQVAYFTGETGDTPQALCLFRTLLRDQEGVLGPDDRDTLSTRNLVAYYTGENGDTNEALRLYSELIRDRERVLGSDDRDTLNTRYQVAYYTGATGDAAEALRIYRALIQDLERALDAHDPLRSATRRQLSLAAVRHGLVDDALEMALQKPILADVALRILSLSESPPSSEILALLWRAGRGDMQADTQLPAELKEIAVELRRRTAPATNAPGQLGSAES